MSAFMPMGAVRSFATEPVFGFDAVMKVHGYLADLFRGSGSSSFAPVSSTDCPVSSRSKPIFDDRARNRGGKVAGIYVVRAVRSAQKCGTMEQVRQATR